jgi:hypothetical protein
MKDTILIILLVIITAILFAEWRDNVKEREIKARAEAMAVQKVKDDAGEDLRRMIKADLDRIEELKAAR